MTKLRKMQGNAASARNRGSPSRIQTATPCTTCTARPARAASRADRGRPWRTSRSMAAELAAPTIRPTASVVRLAVSAVASAGIVVRRPSTSTHSRIARSTGWSRRNAPARQHSLAKACPGSSPATRRRELEKRPRTRASRRLSRSRRPMPTEMIPGRPEPLGSFGMISREGDTLGARGTEDGGCSDKAPKRLADVRGREAGRLLSVQSLAAGGVSRDEPPPVREGRSLLTLRNLAPAADSVAVVRAVSRSPLAGQHGPATLLRRLRTPRRDLPERAAFEGTPISLQGQSRTNITCGCPAPRRCRVARSRRCGAARHRTRRLNQSHHCPIRQRRQPWSTG